MVKVYNFNYKGKKEFSKQYSEEEFRKKKAEFEKFGRVSAIYRIFCSKIEVIDKATLTRRNIERITCLR